MDNSAQCYLGYINRGTFLAFLSLRPVSRRSCELLHTNATVACVRSSRKDSLIEKSGKQKTDTRSVSVWARVAWARGPIHVPLTVLHKNINSRRKRQQKKKTQRQSNW